MAYYHHQLVKMIDAKTAVDDEDPLRKHLGGSVIGKTCPRAIWYSFRWARIPEFSGRIRRLFDRGHAEEHRLIRWLRAIGVEVREYSQRLIYDKGDDVYQACEWEHQYDPEIWADVSHDPHHVHAAKQDGIERRQWRIVDHDGHFGGSLDGIATAGFEIEFGQYVIPPGTEVLLEFKTHNTKSFSRLTETDAANRVLGVKPAKPEHYAQMQVYMHKKGLKFAIYMAVNKNDDDLYIEIVPYDPKVATQMLEKALVIIHTKKPPDRIGKSPTWFDCKFCDFNKICHFGEPMLKTCRSCVNAVPGPEGAWVCANWNVTIPDRVVKVGCEHYKQITD